MTNLIKTFETLLYSKIQKELPEQPSNLIDIVHIADQEMVNWGKDTETNDPIINVNTPKRGITITYLRSAGTEIHDGGVWASIVARSEGEDDKTIDVTDSDLDKIMLVVIESTFYAKAIQDVAKILDEIIEQGNNQMSKNTHDFFNVLFDKLSNAIPAPPSNVIDIKNIRTEEALNYGYTYMSDRDAVAVTINVNTPEKGISIKYSPPKTSSDPATVQATIVYKNEYNNDIYEPVSEADTLRVIMALTDMEPSEMVFISTNSEKRSDSPILKVMVVLDEIIEQRKKLAQKLITSPHDTMHHGSEEVIPDIENIQTELISAYGRNITPLYDKTMHAKLTAAFRAASGYGSTNQEEVATSPPEPVKEKAIMLPSLYSDEFKNNLNCFIENMPDDETVVTALYSSFCKAAVLIDGVFVKSDGHNHRDSPETSPVVQYAIKELYKKFTDLPGSNITVLRAHSNEYEQSGCGSLVIIFILNETSLHAVWVDVVIRDSTVRYSAKQTSIERIKQKE